MHRGSQCRAILQADHHCPFRRELWRRHCHLGWPDGTGGNGGYINDPNRRRFGFYAEYSAQASAPGGELSFDDKSGTKVRAGSVDGFNIGGGNRATFTGPASINNAAGYRYWVEVVDNGEPAYSDTFHLVLSCPTNPLFHYETSGTLAGGDLRVRAY